MPDVYEVRCPDQLDPWRLTWHALFQKTPEAGFFQTLEWLQAYWKHFGSDQQLRVLIVSSRGTPIGIVPLVERTEPTRWGRFRVLTYPLADWGSFFGPLGPHPTATMLAAMRYLRRDRGLWNLLDLRWVDKLDQDRGRTPNAMRAVGFTTRESIWKESAVVETSGRWEDYWADCSSKFRNNIRRQQKRLQKSGPVTLQRYRPQAATFGDGDPRWDLFEDCLHVAAKSWQGDSQSGTTLSHAEVQPFLRDAHAAAARAGMLDLVLLRVDQQPVAFAYNYHYNGRVEGLRAGYDPDFASAGAGALLYYFMIRDSFQREDRSIDMGSGSLNCKRRWTTRIKACYRYTHYPLRSPRSQLLRWKHVLSGHHQEAHGSAPVSTSM